MALEAQSIDLYHGVFNLQDGIAAFLSKYTTNEVAAATTIREETPRRTELAGTYMPTPKTGARAARHFTPNAIAHSATGGEETTLSSSSLMYLMICKDLT